MLAILWSVNSLKFNGYGKNNNSIFQKWNIYNTLSESFSFLAYREFSGINNNSLYYIFLKPFILDSDVFVVFNFSTITLRGSFLYS